MREDGITANVEVREKGFKQFWDKWGAEFARDGNSNRAMEVKRSFEKEIAFKKILRDLQEGRRATALTRFLVLVRDYSLSLKRLAALGIGIIGGVIVYDRTRKIFDMCRASFSNSMERLEQA
jgi:hypothetical protein